MPPRRGFEKAESGVFFTVPPRVQRKMKRSSWKIFTGTTAATRSCCDISTMFTIAFPFAVRPPWGISWTLSQWTRPRSVKTRM